MCKILLLFYLIIQSYSTQYNLVEELQLDKIDLVVLDGQIESEMANQFIFNIFEKDADFYIYIDSNGGDVESGLKIVKMMNYIQKNNIKLKCIAKKAMSMAFHIFQHCDERLILQNSILMQHEMTVYLNGGLQESKSEIDKFIELNNKINLFESTKIKMDLNEYLSELKNELWLSGDDILRHDAADRKVIFV